MPVTSSFHTFYTGVKTGNGGQAVLGAGLFVLDIVSFGEASAGVNSLKGNHNEKSILQNND
jgi:hypothetical protein